METQDLKSRYFSFGCSYTNYIYPTYADYLGATFDLSYNYGQSGAGNTYIYNAFVHAVLKHNIQKGDVVTIQWSSIPRIDRMRNDDLSYGCQGLILNQDNIPKVLIDEFSILQSTLELTSHITSVQAIAKERGITLKMTYMFEPWVGDLLGEPTAHTFKKEHLNQLETQTILFEQLEEMGRGDFFLSKSIEHRRILDTRLWPPSWIHYPQLGYIVDNHPHALEHYEIAIQIAKEMDIDTSDIEKGSILKYVQEIEDWYVYLNDNKDKDFKYLQLYGELKLDQYDIDNQTRHYCSVSPSSILGKIQFKVNTYSSTTNLISPWINREKKKPLKRNTSNLYNFYEFCKKRFRYDTPLQKTLL